MTTEIDPSVVEIWTLYAVATLLIVARVFCRAKLVGVTGFRPDDYLIFFVWALYTTVCVMATLFALVAQGRHTSLLTPEQRRTMPESEFHLWEYGSKNFVAGMTVYAAIVWTLKFHMLFFYRRLVEGQWVERFISPVMGLVGATAIAMILVIALTCRPISLMWQIRPDPGEHCVPQNKIYFYSILIANLTTDFCIIAIPIPVISLVRASIWRRIGVYFLFGLGIFCMLAAIVRVTLTFHPTGQFGPAAMWSIREDFVAIFVGQVPMIVPLFKKRYWTQSKYHFTPKSSQRSDGIEMSNGMLGNNKKPRDPYSLTQLGFTHITNVTQATQSELTVDANNKAESLAVNEGKVFESPQHRVTGPRKIDRGGQRPKQSLEITVLPDLPRPDAEQIIYD
ncbi:hypothetical protein CI238_12370 [Colletotrichum incanum]|uniref:Rhodopsin domain-containing protein n=1 Tax=Colletotrichum incanum TaxID=1573173 RepID=A0A166ZNJ2_COLIC|nr:hypothetical protein CI238_12370 [Colletotrichum incanum]OHW98652.1 hypothetical protein CSPAE12_02640 [Colletotrichum incanum]